MRIIHKSADEFHYDQESESYDLFNTNNTLIINSVIERILLKHKIQSVLDITCGTGLQLFYLLDKGFKVEGLDINQKMLTIAKEKAQAKHIDIQLIKGDIRTSKVGKFDAVISIFNAIGHLTKEDFIKAIGNIADNLNDNGLYIFDIFNLNYLLYKDNITKLTIDWQKKEGDTVFREIQYSTINKEGILASYDIYHKEKKDDQPEIMTAFQTLQVYSSYQLKEILDKNGFDVIELFDINGEKFNDVQSERILAVAKKRAK